MTNFYRHKGSMTQQEKTKARKDDAWVTTLLTSAAAPYTHSADTAVLRPSCMAFG